MVQGLISIFVLPLEIDNLHLTLYNLRRNAEFLPKNISFTFDITLCVSDELIQWNTSDLPKEYFVNKFNEITSVLCDWAPNSTFRIEEGKEILGCVSQRRHTLKYVDDYEFTLWMDNDLFFADTFLGYLGHAINAIKQNTNTEYYIITPQITRQWDESWDILVKPSLLSRPLNDNLTANVFNLCLNDTGVSVSPIPVFKAAGGWGTVISNKLLKLTGIPDSFGHYGLEDTYVLTCAQMLNQYGKQVVQQYVLNDVMVCENHKQTNNYVKKMIYGINRKDEFRQIATQNFQKELERFYNENILQNK